MKKPIIIPMGTAIKEKLDPPRLWPKRLPTGINPTFAPVRKRTRPIYVYPTPISIFVRFFFERGFAIA